MCGRRFAIRGSWLDFRVHKSAALGSPLPDPKTQLLAVSLRGVPQVWQDHQVGIVLRLDELTVAQGESGDFTDYSPLQSTVMPVVSLQEGRLQCWGTAACIGPAGWFLTAGHVVDDFVAAYGDTDDGTTGLFILWETDETLGNGPNNYLGAPLAVHYLHRHSSADLVTLSVALHPLTPDRLRVAALALRMPAVGEPLAVVGYRKMSLSGDVRPGEMSSIDYERTLTIGVGVVLEQQPHRRGAGLRGSPGVVTDAPIRSGMSGGPVFDRNREIVGFASSSMEPITPGEPWNSYVALCGPALELDVMCREFDDSELKAMTLANLVAKEAIPCSLYDSFDVESDTGHGVYRAT
jgi:hypothetical protein